MDRAYRSLMAAVVVAALAVALAGCGGGGGATPEPQNVGSVEGVIRDFSTGVGLGGVVVRIGGQEATSDANGRFVVNNVPAGTHIMTLIPPDWLSLPPGSEAYEVRVRTGETTQLPSPILLLDRADLPPDPPAVR